MACPSTRFVLLLALVPCLSRAQFKSAVPMVVVPATITDPSGRYVDGLAESDLTLFDNNVPQTIHVDWTGYPIDLAVVVQTTSNSRAVIDKLGGAGILLTQLIAATGGKTAVISFSGEARIRQSLTSDPDLVARALRLLRVEGQDAHILDALRKALVMLVEGQPGTRKIVLVIAEKRDRSSRAGLADVMEQVERLNAVVYWLNFSPLLQPFTAKPRTAEDLKPLAERITHRECAVCPDPDDSAVPLDVGPGGSMYAIGELMHLRQPDISDLFTRVTGGRSINFLKKNDLERAIGLIGEEIHRQYIIDFEPRSAGAGAFHSIRVQVNGRPELTVKARDGYWPLP